jgi:hypothetical protein
MVASKIEEGQGPRAESYLRSNHIAHPATIAPPRNMAKQYRP